MRNLDSRLDKLEHGLGLASDLPRFNAIVDRLDRALALTTDRCIEILDEEGCLRAEWLQLNQSGLYPRWTECC